jgi:hypothetical protein
MAPKTGAKAATMRLAIELAMPSRKVVVVTSTPVLQYCLKNTGKNPAITLVAKAELAQSYKDQEITFLLTIFLSIYLL